MSLLPDDDEPKLFQPLSQQRPTWYRVVRWVLLFVVCIAAILALEILRQYLTGEIRPRR